MIILFRHAKPIIDYGSCNYSDAVDRLNNYNSTINLKLDELVLLSDELKILALQNNPIIVYSSVLPRSIKTAQYIFDPLGIGVNNNSTFSEFDLNVFKIPKIKLSVQAWFLISRVAWLFGFIKNIRF